MSEKNLTSYYDQRAQEYDAIYQKPEQQSDFKFLRTWLEQEVKGKCVLEVACGTGYWTAVAARSAQLIVATDINESVLNIARGKWIKNSPQFILADGYQLPSFDQRFTCGMAHFWLSHVPKSTLAAFTRQFISHLSADSTLLFIDSKFVAGYRKPATRTDNDGNTYQNRKLKDGSTFEIVKNFLSEKQLLDLFAPMSRKVTYEELDYLWAIKVQV